VRRLQCRQGCAKLQWTIHAETSGFLVRARMMQIRLDLFQEQLAFLWDAARSYLEEVGLHNEEKIIRFQLPQIL
jgi:hypothetical protein